MIISIEKMADNILKRGIQLGASDIHILPRKEGPLVQFRIDNHLVPQETLTFDETERLISHLKFLASMDIGEKRRPQNGAITITLDDKVVGLRLSTLPTAYLESLVIRLIPQYNILPLEQLSLSKHCSSINFSTQTFTWHDYFYRSNWIRKNNHSLFSSSSYPGTVKPQCYHP